MALSESRVQYVRTMTSYVKQYNQGANINDNCVVAIVAQSCLESRWGESTLSSQYYNFWGMKCGSHWTGKSVNLETWEETPEGDIKVSSDFRVYDSWVEGVQGYFTFISTSRYENLQTATTPEEYLTLIKADGWATSSSYVSDTMAVVRQIDYLVNDTEAGSDPQPPQPPPPYGSDPSNYTENVQIAMQMLNGYWGDTPEDIRANLTASGYDYEEIMETAGGMFATICVRHIRRKK